MQAQVIDDAVRRQLRWVASNGVTDLRCFPDFFIVGPQRTGTTWLHANLRYHPQVFLSEPKELFFFSRLKTPQHPRFQSNELGWYLRFFHDPLWRRLAKIGICLWQSRALYRPRVRGEATASYAVLDRDIISEISALKPDIKVILMVRDPIERAWSHAKKDLVRNRGRKLGEVSEREFQDFFTDPYQRRCARYVEACDNWAAHLREGHLLVCFFDDIAVRPEAMLTEVMAFLGVDAKPRYFGPEVRTAVNPTATVKIPVQYRQFLEELLQPDIEQLKARWRVSWPLGPHPLVLRLP